MEERDWLAEKFEANRTHLQGVAFRMLGSLSEADDAVQETWLRLSRSDASQVENLSAWLTTVVSRVCLDMLRRRKARHEELLDSQAPAEPAGRSGGNDPESETLLADSVGLALLVVLEALAPAERVAFVLHDTFAVHFDEIARILGSTPAAVRQMASRARRRVRGVAAAPGTDLDQQRQVVEAFLEASRNGDFEALLAILDPNAVVRADRFASPTGKPIEVRGARLVATQALAGGRRSPFAETALVDGEVGIVVAPRGRLFLVMTFIVQAGRIVEIEVHADPERLRYMRLEVLDRAGK